jgi:hypothetical protein
MLRQIELKDRKEHLTPFGIYVPSTTAPGLSLGMIACTFTVIRRVSFITAFRNDKEAKESASISL